MVSLTVENYLKTILLLANRAGEKMVSTGKLAEAMSVSPGTVTSMLKTLSDSKLATYTPYVGVTLTESGQTLAMRMLRRHRLIELFLVNTLHMTWDQVHEEAEHMEHAVSEFLIDRIDDFLDHPSVDPHGDPIPGQDGVLRKDLTNQGVPLSSCEQGTHFELVRVYNQDPEFLRYLSDQQLSIGCQGQVVSKSDKAGLITVEVDQQTIPLGLSAAMDLIVISKENN